MAHELKYEDFLTVNRGIHRIDYEDFRDVVMRFTPVGEPHMRAWWSAFALNPAAFMCSRNPTALGQALFDLAAERGEEVKPRIVREVKT